MREIKGYEGLYSVTSCGKVWSHIRNAWMKILDDKDGYKKVNLYDRSGKMKTFRVHRLVAIAYIENPNNLPQINHKDEIPYHNWLNNLEWCDAKYNNNYGGHNARISKSLSKPVRCVETGVIYESALIASKETGLDNSDIGKCCKGKLKTVGKLHWEYVEVKEAM